MLHARRILNALSKGILARAESFAASSLKEPAEWVSRWFGGRRSSSGVEVTPQTAIQITAVLAAVRIISQSAASLPLKLHRRVGKKTEEATGHPLHQLLHLSPNENQTSLEFREMLQGHLCLRGNAYSFIDYANSGIVKALVPMHPDKVYPRVRNDALVYEYHRGNGAIEEFRPDEILHLKGFSVDGLLGISPISEAREALGISLAAEQFGGRFFANDTHVGAVITSPKNLSEKARKNVRSGLEGARGVNGAGRTVILDEGMQYTRIGMTAQDAQFLETRKFQITEIARLFGVPPHLLADLERSTFSNIEAQGREFLMYCLGPWLTRWEQRLNLTLLRPSERQEYFFKHNIAAFLRGDSLTQARVLQIERANGITSANEWRAIHDRNPREDEDGDTYLRPGNMIPEASDLDPTMTNKPKDVE